MNNIALLFPGQGSQYVGMGKELYDNYEIAQKVYEEACDYLKIDIKKLCFEGSIEELTQTSNTQLAVFVTCVAAFKVFQNETNIKPKYFLGHSLGEITALTCAGVFRFEDALDIVRIRGEYMQECAINGEGAMAAIKGIDFEYVKSECLKYSDNNNLVSISNYNSPNEIVISGHKKAVLELGRLLQNKNAKVVPLKVGAAFHSSLMQPAAEKFKHKLKLMNFALNEPDRPVVSNVIAFPYERNTDIINMLSEQIVRPVQWYKSMTFLAEEGVDTVIEIGPKNVLTKIAKETFEEVKAFSFDQEKDIINSIFKLNDNCKLNNDSNENRINFIEKSLSIAVCTPNFNLDDSDYEKKVSKPYKEIKSLLNQLLIENKKPDNNQMNQCIDMLISVFEYKGISLEEKNARFQELLKLLGEDNIIQNYLLNSRI